MGGPAFIDFRDGKEPGAFRTIGEVGKALGIRQHVLRYWEEQFPMLRPLTRAGGRRYYRPEDVALVARIDRLVHHQGYTLRGARQAIEASPHEGAAVAEVVVSAPATPSDRPPLSPDDKDDLVGAVRLLATHLQTISTRLADALAESER
jgi:DNA-binding transcriptional MerR regulator